ncbi:MAG: TPM domain-containing protein [Lachnospiraceae bacterium]|nr:TPM domain-containing protein [Lachnospiraceae bacterium]
MSQDYDVKAEARKQYLRYFKGWFILLGLLTVICGVMFGGRLLKGQVARTNDEAPDERVYDHADVLSDSEEEKLSKLIEKAQAEIQADIVLVTIDQAVEGSEAQKEYGYHSDDWEQNMVDLADDFYAKNMFGYDEDEYSGLLLLVNWYSDSDGSQRGAHLATFGSARERLGDRENDQIIDGAMDVLVAGGSHYKAYKTYVDKAVDFMDVRLHLAPMWIFVVAALIIPAIVALIFVTSKAIGSQGKVTTSVNTYVSENSRNNTMDDSFIRKSVTSTRISTSSSSGGGGTRSGGGGGGGRSYVSSSGRTHGGASRRI